MFVNRMPRYEILSPDALDVLERGWQRIVSEIGIDFVHDEAVELLRRAGQKVDGTVVHLDPEWVLEQVALAPSEFELRARNPARSVRVGGDHMVFAAVSGSPFFREGDVRREGTMADLERLLRLVQHFGAIDLPGAPSVEPNDLPLDSRHLDMMYAYATLTDKPYIGSALSDVNARDCIRMTEILHRGLPMHDRDGPGGVPVTSLLTVVNVNSPLRYDTRMLEALLAYSAAGQAVVVTPFLLMGAMAPVSVPSALAQQTAEALAGVALTQLVNPGVPVVFGSFLSTIDMQSGSPSFGGPESAQGLYASGQIARRYGLPWRAGGGALTSSQTVDVQAAYEGLTTMLASFMAGPNLMLHAAGWLESGLVASLEKFMVDLEILQVLQHEFTPLEIDEASLAFEAHDEVRHGGHFLGAAHTMERFRTCFYRPMLSSTENYERWVRKGARDGTARAGELWRKALDEYEQPPLEESVREELADYVARRRTELGD